MIAVLMGTLYFDRMCHFHSNHRNIIDKVTWLLDCKTQITPEMLKMATPGLPIFRLKAGKSHTLQLLLRVSSRKDSR